MNGIVRSLLFLTAIGLLAVVLICASDDSEALDKVEHKVNFNPEEVLVYYAGFPVDPLTDIDVGFTIHVVEKTGYCNPTINGIPYDYDVSEYVIIAAERDGGILVQAEKVQYSIDYETTVEVTGTFPDQTTYCTIDSTAIILSPLFSRVGYHFEGWNTSNNGTGDDFSPGNYDIDTDFITDHYGMDTRLVLYPKWSSLEYSINYNLNNGIGQLPDDISGKTIGMEMTIQPVNLTRTGYTTTIWNMSPDGSGLDVGIGDAVFDAAFITNYFGNGTEITLYPKWVVNHYAISFDSTEEIRGTLPDSLNDFTIGSVINVPSAPLTRTGYTLDGWNTSTDRSGIDFQPGNYTVDGAFLERYYEPSGRSLILYPKWVVNHYAISFDSVEEFKSALPDSLNDFTIGSAIDISSVSLTRTGYTLDGWNTSTDRSGDDLQPGRYDVDTSFLERYYEPSGRNITLYPKWVENHYAIRFDSTEEMRGALPDSLNDFTIGSLIEVSSAPLTRTGYILGGWNTSADRAGIDLQPGRYTIDASFLERYYEPSGRTLILYPKWIPVEYSISLSSEYGTMSDADWSLADSKLSRSYNIESELISLPTPEPDDRFHLFINWEDSEGNPVSQIATGTIGDIELKAAWTEKTYPITAMINGKQVTFDLTLSSEMPTAEPEDGFAFKGWYYRDDDGNEVRFESMSQMNENMEIYAVFEPIQDDPVEIAVCVIAIVVFFVTVIGYGFTRE